MSNLDKAQGLYTFWSMFGLPAYDEQTIPGDAKIPYITYETQTGCLDETLYLTGSIWYYGNSWGPVTQKADEIEEEITGGTIIPIKGGALWITKGSPFTQRAADDDSTVRRILIQIQAEFLTA